MQNRHYFIPQRTRRCNLCPFCILGGPLGGPNHRIYILCFAPTIASADPGPLISGAPFYSFLINLIPPLGFDCFVILFFTLSSRYKMDLWMWWLNQVLLVWVDYLSVLLFHNGAAAVDVSFEEMLTMTSVRHCYPVESFVKTPEMKLKCWVQWNECCIL